MAVPGSIVLASTSDANVKGNDASERPWLSADGTRVAFASLATNLHPADGDDFSDVYVKDLATGDLLLASTSDAGVKGDYHSGSDNQALSGDGRRVAFASGALNLDPADVNAISDVYVKDLTTGDLTLTSTSDTGVKANFHSSEMPPGISKDGTRVAFVSLATNLDPADSDIHKNTFDVYVKDLVTGDIMLASTNDSGVKGNSTSGTYGPFLSANGNRVAFDSGATNLDPGDADSMSDV